MNIINIVLLNALLITTAPAQQPIARETTGRIASARIEQNISASLQSENLGVQASTIQLIIDLSKVEPKQDLDYTVIPLLDILKTNTHPELRILAALGLYHLDSETGKFAVSRRVQFEDSERVAKMCKRILNEWNAQEKSAGTGFAYTAVEGL